MSTASSDIRKRDATWDRSVPSTPTTSVEWGAWRAAAATLKPTVYCPPPEVDHCVKNEPSQ